MSAHVHRVRVYYEDTDFSGVVYHANYLKYFERAREHLLGPDELVRLYRESGIGFVVYKAELAFREGARFGDELDIRTTVALESEYRAVFTQEAWRVGGASRPGPLVTGKIQLVCVDAANALVPLPGHVQAAIRGAVAGA